MIVAELELDLEVFTGPFDLLLSLILRAQGALPELALAHVAVPYRDVLEAGGAVVPPDDDPVHVPHARLHVRLAASFGPVDAIEPIYVRTPDAERWVS